MTRLQVLRLLLRLFGSSSLAATIFVAAPESWMRTIHASLGMGDLPEAPVVGYLARSTSALYAILGGLFWTLSFDPVRHRPVLRYLGFALASFGLALFVIDRVEGMPLVWNIWEGTAVTSFGLAIAFLSKPDAA